MDFATIQAQLAKLTSQVSQYAERTTMPRVPTCGLSYGQGYPTHQCSQFTANEDAWGYQGHSQSWDNMFSNAYNSDCRDYSDYMWGEPQHIQHEAYWQPYESYSTPMQPPQPHLQYAKPGSSKDYNQILAELISLAQGSQIQAEEAQQEGYWQPYEEFYSTPMQSPQPPPQQFQPNSGSSIDCAQILDLLTTLAQEQQDQAQVMSKLKNQFGEIAEFMEQMQEQSELSNSNSTGNFEIDEAFTLESGVEVGTSQKSSKPSHEEDERLLLEEEEEDTATTSLEEGLLQLPNGPMPSNSSKEVPNPILYDLISSNVPIPCRSLQSKEEEREKDNLEAFPKVQVDIPIPELSKEDVPATPIPEEVGFYDTGQVTTLTINLAKCNSPSISPWCGMDAIPETFEVVFVLEFMSEHKGKPPPRISISFYTNRLLMIQAPTQEFKPLPDHFKYHLPFKDKFHDVGPRGV